MMTLTMCGRIGITPSIVQCTCMPASRLESVHCPYKMATYCFNMYLDGVLISTVLSS